MPNIIDQDAKRLAMRAIVCGRSAAEIVSVTGLNPGTVQNWMNSYKRGNLAIDAEGNASRGSGKPPPADDETTVNAGQPVSPAAPAVKSIMLGGAEWDWPGWAKRPGKSLRGPDRVVRI